MDARTVWVLNLDAELELASRGAYLRAPKMAALVRTHAARLSALLPPGHVALDEDAPAGAHEGARGRAYCPTPSALEALRRAGARPDPAPPLDVLRAANDRAFSLALGATLPGQAMVHSEAALEACLREAPDLGGGFFLKRRWSMAGRGKRRVGRALDEADRRFVRAALREQGALLVEPFAPILLEVSLHGELARDGALALGAPVVQACDASGAFASARLAEEGELAPAERAALEDAARRAAAALRSAGYFGPFGVDAFRYRGADGAPAFRALSELNARLTMALPLGLPAALTRAAP